MFLCTWHLAKLAVKPEKSAGVLLLLLLLWYEKIEMSETCVIQIYVHFLLVLNVISVTLKGKITWTLQRTSWSVKLLSFVNYKYTHVNIFHLACVSGKEAYEHNFSENGMWHVHSSCDLTFTCTCMCRNLQNMFSWKFIKTAMWKQLQTFKVCLRFT